MPSQHLVQFPQDLGVWGVSVIRFECGLVFKGSPFARILAMAHFAEVNNDGTVLRVCSVAETDINYLNFPASEFVGQTFLNSVGFTGLWKQTSYNNNFRKQYAGVGFTYDEVADVFVQPQPYASWSLDANSDWQAPTPKPEGDYMWDEETLAWVMV